MRSFALSRRFGFQNARLTRREQVNYRPTKRCLCTFHTDFFALSSLRLPSVSLVVPADWIISKQRRVLKLLNYRAHFITRAIIIHSNEFRARNRPTLFLRATSVREQSGRKTTTESFLEKSTRRKKCRRRYRSGLINRFSARTNMTRTRRRVAHRVSWYIRHAAISSFRGSSMLSGACGRSAI